MARLRVGLLFGGRSLEHEVSVASATSILRALDPSRYEIALIAIDRAGRWHVERDATRLPDAVATAGLPVILPPEPGATELLHAPDTRLPKREAQRVGLDVVFPIVHGRGGEDGALQGLLELAEVAYVGSGVLSSAVQMDKDIAKRLLAAAGLPVLPWRTLRSHELAIGAAEQDCLRELGLPLFVKPANSGSSVGISKAHDAQEFSRALREASRYDTKILIERALAAREVEVAVLGNQDPIASLPGEICPDHEFYDYEAKYQDESTRLLVPAPIDEALGRRLRELALEAYRLLEAEGMARVDFLIDRESLEPYINELNSLPGFTDASMYPRLWQASGLDYPDLLDRLIELALERRERRSRLETTYTKTPG